MSYREDMIEGALPLDLPCPVCDLLGRMSKEHPQVQLYWECKICEPKVGKATRIVGDAWFDEEPYG